MWGALVLYARRFRLYALLAAAAFGVQVVAQTALPHTEGTAQALALVVDAFLIGAVSIGVSRDVAGTETGSREILGAAVDRWGAVAVASLLYVLVVLALFRAVFGSLEETGYGFFIMPVIGMWGAVSLSQVVAAIEPVKSRLMLPVISIGKALSVSLRFTNLGRLLFLSALLTMPLIAQGLLASALAARHVGNAQFWSDVPLDAMLTGPLQAIATLFYLDFVRRAERS